MSVMDACDLLRERPDEHDMVWHCSARLRREGGYAEKSSVSACTPSVLILHFYCVPPPPSPLQGILAQRGDPVTANDAVQELLERARGLCREQEAKKEELEANYLESFNLARENWAGEIVYFIFVFCPACSVCVCVLLRVFFCFFASCFSIVCGVVSPSSEHLSKAGRVHAEGFVF